MVSQQQAVHDRGFPMAIKSTPSTHGLRPAPELVSRINEALDRLEGRRKHTVELLSAVDHEQEEAVFTAVERWLDDPMGNPLAELVEHYKHTSLGRCILAAMGRSYKARALHSL
jgi:hypothetical protein